MGLTITLHVNCIEKPTCPSNQMPYNLHNKTTKQFLHCALSIQDIPLPVIIGTGRFKKK